MGRLPDNEEDQTIGIPRPRRPFSSRTPESAPPRPPSANPSAGLPPIAPRPASARGFDDQEDSPNGTILPPGARPSRPMPGAPSPPRADRVRPDAFDPFDRNRPPSPEPLARPEPSGDNTFWPAAPGFPAAKAPTPGLAPNWPEPSYAPPDHDTSPLPPKRPAVKVDPFDPGLSAPEVRLPYVPDGVDPSAQTPSSMPQAHAPARPPYRPPVQPPRNGGGGDATMVVGLPQADRPIGFGFKLQYFEKNGNSGHWKDLNHIPPEGLLVGRGTFHPGTPSVEYLANDHLRITCEDNKVFAEEGQTVNGVYRKLLPQRPTELASGARFQVGQYVLEFRAGGQAGSDSPLVAPGGEVFRSRRIEAVGFVDVVGPDNRTDLRFPLIKSETTIGREAADIVLAGDSLTSRAHARIFRKGDQFFLEDLGSTNGTFVRISGRAHLKLGGPQGTSIIDELLIGLIPIRVVTM